jgi:hypothetical protein
MFDAARVDLLGGFMFAHHGADRHFAATVSLAELTRDPELACRAAGVSKATATEYAEAMRAGVVFPPVVVFVGQKGERGLTDGFHRCGDSPAISATPRPFSYSALSPSSNLLRVVFWCRIIGRRMLRNGSRRTGCKRWRRRNGGRRGRAHGRCVGKCCDWGQRHIGW